RAAAGPGGRVTRLVLVRNAVVDPQLPPWGRGRPRRIGLPVGRRHEPRWRRWPAGGRVETQSQRASLGEVSAWVTRYTLKRPPSAEHSSQSAARCELLHGRSRCDRVWIYATLML